MYLKSIEVQGFKSFANKIVFDFHNGITGIVGPNGSGKSNVADAVRWVLGEQRIKQLRGASMQDVIFSGTETRKPQGFAYVAITLDNQDHKLAIDFDEVTVSRRIYRSGESEYMLNGSPCRLKDINELFYDTGIGKEGYSIIGQGQIDKILSGRPEERRELFDEAAGIVKFKRRKAIAQKKLEDEKQNLIRISDILSELEKQVGPLKKQSETAREYLRLKEDLKRCDVGLFLSETAVIREQLSEIVKNLSVVTGDMENSRTDVAGIRETQEALEEEIRVLEEALREKQEAGNEALMTAGNLEGQVNVLKEQIRTEEMNAEHIKNRIAAIEGELKEREERKKEYQSEKEGLTGQAEEMKKRLEEAEEALSARTAEADSLEQGIEETKAGIIDALNEKSSFSVKKQRYDTMLEQVQVRRSEVAQKLLKVKSDEEGWALKIKEEEERKRELEAAIEELLARADGLEEEIKEASAEIARLNRNLNNTQQEYHRASTRLESLRNLAERYEGYGNSIRRVMETRDRVHGIHGVVADLIDVPKEYETAIETALGGSIQNIVTDSEETAKVLIEYLKKNKFGRATFLPLTSISARGGFERPEALKEPGAIGLASSLVKADRQYDGLIQYLLGRVLVVKDIDTAIAIARKYRHSFRIVTPAGELLNPGGSMSGGAYKNSSNLLGRKREMEEFEELCKKALLQVDSIQKELVFQEGLLEERSGELETVKKELQARYLEENTAGMNLSKFSERQTELLESSADMKLENRQLEEQMQEIRSETEKLLAAMKVLEEENEARNRRIEEDTKALETARENREEARRFLSGIQLSAASLSQKEDFLLENMKRLGEEEEKLLKEKEALSGGTEQSAEAVAGKKKEIETLFIRIEEEKKRAAALSEEAGQASEAKEEKNRTRRQLSEKREELSDRISRLDKEAFRLQNQKEKQEERQEGLVNYMWSEYGLTYSTAAELSDGGEIPVPELKKQIHELKNTIRALGNVNVNAIEDYKEISERYEFMKGQHDDLTAAQETLYKIIEELDTGMRRQFAEKFAEIRREFDRVFKELFGGGHGTLELIEDEDILEAGIQIISQPPGKKLQNMMQMSGGEKALTAIALLFAIQNLKPSPFCLLDEIEAALDDSNVDRFAKYLHKLTKNTQFIVITHRRGTMVSADRLYGITMQEKGVSTLVSVSLIENDLDK
jgi:chromosome segregation protein